MNLGSASAFADDERRIYSVRVREHDGSKRVAAGVYGAGRSRTLELCRRGPVPLCAVASVLAPGAEGAGVGRLDLAESVNARIRSRRKKSAALSAQPPKIEIDNISSSFFTIIEVFAYDFTGLLFGVTDALFKCGLDIRVAKIATNVDQVVDVFYVRDFDGQKADAPEHIEKIKAAIDNVIPGVSLEIVGADLT